MRKQNEGVRLFKIWSLFPHKNRLFWARISVKMSIMVSSSKLVSPTRAVYPCSLSFSCLLKTRWSKLLKYSFQTLVYTDHVDLALELLVSFNWFMVQEDAALLICSPIDILLALRLPQMLGPGFHWVISPDSCRRQLPCQAHMKCLPWTVLSPRTEPYQILHVRLESWIPGDELCDVCNNQKIKAKPVVSMVCLLQGNPVLILFIRSQYKNIVNFI